MILISNMILFLNFCYSEHEVPHMLNDGSWTKDDGPLHDLPSEQLFLKMKSIHDKTCVHVDLDISDQVQEQFNDFLHARNKYAINNNIENGNITDVVIDVTVHDGKYYLNGIKKPKLNMIAGVKYTFLTGSLYKHPFRIGTDDEPVSPFSSGVTYTSEMVTVQLPVDVNVTTLTYYCLYHPTTMGNEINVVEIPSNTYIVTAIPGKYYINGQVNPEISLLRGETYIFDISDPSINLHPFKIGVLGSTYEEYSEVTNKGSREVPIEISLDDSSGEIFCPEHSLSHSCNCKSDCTENPTWCACAEASSCCSRGFVEAVTLSGKGYVVETNILEEVFNERFKACPVVQYTRNSRVHSVYKRTSTIPDNFNAYELFTYMWSDKNNTLHEDFEIYDDKDDLLESRDKWEFCNYNDPDVGYPRDCGKKIKTNSRWFSMPGGRRDAPHLERGASFHIHSAVGCPSTSGSQTPYNKGVTKSINGKQIIFVVPIDAPSKLTYYCEYHPNMSNNIVIPKTVGGLMAAKMQNDTEKITYDMACVQKYPNNPRFAMQMSLYCMTAFFSSGDVSEKLFDSPYGISSSCDTMMRMNKRTLEPSTAYPPYAFCNQNIEDDTCTVRALVMPYNGRTCRSYCESFHGLKCASANIALNPSNGGKCHVGREMSCDAEQVRENFMLCTCTTDDEYVAKVGAPTNTERPLTPSAAKLFVQPQSELLLCDQNYIDDTVKVFTLQTQTCHTFCLSAGLTCFGGASANEKTCVTKSEYPKDECFQRRSHQLCTCGPFVELDQSLIVEASVNVREATKYDLAYKLDIPNKVYLRHDVPYSTNPDFSSGFEFTRIAYYMQLIDYKHVVQWVWVSMDAFTKDLSKIAVPTFNSQAIFQQEVYNMTISSNIAEIDGYKGIGNIEFWPTNYGTANEKMIEGANGGYFDWGDIRSTGGDHGSMQVHAANLSSTIFAFNHWNRNRVADIGIGNSPNKVYSDWTNFQNADRYLFKRIEVFVSTNTSTLSPTIAPSHTPTISPSLAPSHTSTTSPSLASSHTPSVTPYSDCPKDNVEKFQNGSKNKTCKKWLKKKTEQKCRKQIFKDNCPVTCEVICVSAISNIMTIQDITVNTIPQFPSDVPSIGFSTDLVALYGSDITVKFDKGEENFNAAFAACPVVQYTNNNKVTAVYRRKSLIPEGFNAYKLFTSDWEETNNTLNIDFEIYDNEKDLLNSTGKWIYCDYGNGNDGYGFPRNCGKESRVYNRWFSMPTSHSMKNLKNGASFAVHSSSGCPIEAPIDSPGNCTEAVFLGCFRDASNPRALPVRKGSNGSSIKQCLASCAGYNYVGRQYHGECWCGNEGYDKYGEMFDCDCENKKGNNVGGKRNCVYDFQDCWSKFQYKIVASESQGLFIDKVELDGTDISVKTDAGEKKFNAAFAACPAVQYTRNEAISAVYRRRTPIPEGFNAYKLFTTNWEQSNNMLHKDFEIYDNKEDLVNHEGKWVFCDYGTGNDGYGFPRNCGKENRVHNKWFSMPTSLPLRKMYNIGKGASFAVHSAEGCPIDALVSRNNSTEVNNNACERMAMQPHNGIKSYYGADRIIQNVSDSCTVESSILEFDISTCDEFCGTFQSMKCVGAHNDSDAIFQDGKAARCDAVHVNKHVACQCALDVESLDEEKNHSAAPTSDACINLAFGGDFTSHEIYEYCDSNNTIGTCTVNVNAFGQTTSCSKFCSSHQGMQCVSAFKTDLYNERLLCESSTTLKCDEVSDNKYLQCECGFVPGSERSDILKKGPVLEENVQEYCPAYTTVEGNDHANEAERRYQKITLTLGVDDSLEADGSIPVVAAKMVRDNSDRNLDSYNTQDVEVCTGLEYTKEDSDPPETCSFGHRYDSKSNCYGKLEMSFKEASQKCDARGGHLLRLDNEEELYKLNLVFRRQRFSIGLHSDSTSDGMEWDGYPGCKVDLEKDLNFVERDYRHIKDDCWELDLGRTPIAMRAHSCTETRTWICEARRPTKKVDNKIECKKDDELSGPGGDLMRDEGGFCLWYLENPKLTLPDDESGGFRNTEIAHFLAFSQDTRTRKYYKEYGKLVDADFLGYYDNDVNWGNLTRDKFGFDSIDPVVDINHESDDFHCHFSPTNFGISRIYLQQHMLERIYPGAFKKHCFCGHKHIGKLVSRCDCTKNGVRNGQCQKEHRPMLYESTYKENGEYVYCNNGQCEALSP